MSDVTSGALQYFHVVSITHFPVIILLLLCILSEFSLVMKFFVKNGKNFPFPFTFLRFFLSLSRTYFLSLSPILKFTIWPFVELSKKEKEKKKKTMNRIHQAFWSFSKKEGKRFSLIQGKEREKRKIPGKFSVSKSYWWFWNRATYLIFHFRIFYYFFIMKWEFCNGCRGNLSSLHIELLCKMRLL